MASDQQVALTRIQRMPAQSSHISKAARQVVPAFLQKLYEMVNDPNNAELIRWSEAGDSFFVLDHERFAHEVLGRWFKHRNFNSFVRQLNMYGFHKIPHLQQGVLKSDTDTEFWNFAHPNFHRGQPDLLCLIQRKKQAAQPGGDNTIELRDISTGIGLVGGPTSAPGVPPPPGSATLSNNQVLDIQSIVSGINAIKRHQTTISSELNELKQSNQLLWQDALTARAKHQKQQDTINRIVKFLAGVFGNHSGTASPGGVSVAGSSPGSGQHGKSEGGETPLGHRRARLMIEDAKRDGPPKSIIEELTDMDLDHPTTYAYPTIETPGSVPSPSPSIDGSAYYNLESNVQTPVTEVAPKQPQPKLAAPSDTPLVQDQGKEVSRAVTPSMSPNNLDFSGVLNQLSPAQIQQLLASLAAQTFTDPANASTGTINPNATSTIAPYQPPTFDFLQSNPNAGFNPIPPHDPDDLIPFEHYDPQAPQPVEQSIALPDNQEHEERMDRQWKVTEDIDKDVSALNNSINSLIQTFGLDPTAFENLEHPRDDLNGSSVPSGIPDVASNVPSALDEEAPAGADFDFETFLNNFPSTGAGMGDLDTDLGGMDYANSLGGAGAGTSAFLDEPHTPAGSSDMTGSPMQPLRHISPEVNMGTAIGRARSSSLADSGGSLALPTTGGATATKGRKRKSEVVTELDSNAMPADASVKGGAGTKSKRRKEK